MDVVNGWAYTPDGVGDFGTNYDFRASASLNGWGVNLRRDAIYPLMFNIPSTAAGYVLHFGADELLPVEAFWSLTILDSDGYLTDNPAHITSVGYTRTPVTNKDGSVSIFIQSSAPEDKDIAAYNWLPQPQTDTFRLTLRLCSPGSAAQKNQWRAPGLQPQS